MERKKLASNHILHLLLPCYTDLLIIVINMILVAREREAFTASALGFITVVFCSVLTALFVAGEVCIPGAGYFLLDREMNGNENRTMSTFVLMYKSLHSSTAIINGKVVTGKFRVLSMSETLTSVPIQAPSSWWLLPEANPITHSCENFRS